MNPTRVDRHNLNKLTDLPNIGKACQEDLLVLGIHKPEDLIGHCPYEMHASLCAKTGVQHDVCMIDVFISVTRFMEGGKPQAWWKYTDERKAALKLKGDSQ